MTCLSPDKLVKDFLAFFLDEIEVLETDLQRRLGSAPLPVDWNMDQALQLPPGDPPPIIYWQILKSLKRAGECGLAVLAAMTADPERHDTTLMWLHPKIAAVALQFSVLEICLEKGRRFPWCEEHRRRWSWRGE